ncbi:FAD-binding oxidoreductase [Haloarchaeobius sp. HME9146]|uniref:NAD(P)/FAD-dependent oxidoreductase n=1 Tax=Haloarchaeobius sp. HME9146 TaxID=2978732 RepID=UPI0021BEFF33|nr:FAD-dependent oxidoreductase [Haloarchaeobius sp. HME9146]MCT9096334.1 FAD-binding oxidoreductase [Haloarchaeobius sp. HME9146]
MNVVVIGGGIVGLATAYSLADRGTDVVVCEKGSIGSGSTERSAGGIRHQFSTRVNVQLSRESVRVWESFEEEFGIDIAYRRAGYLLLAREEATADAFETNVEMQNEEGVDSRLLSPEDAAAVCPELDAEKFCAATYCPTDGFADPHLALQGFSQAATEAGAEIRTKTAVTAINTEDGEVVGVETEEDSLDADFVVNAAGPWAGRVAEMAGLDLPVAPRRRQVAVVDPETPVPDDVPLTIDLDTGSYFRPEREGSAIVGGHFAAEDPDVDPDGFDGNADLDWMIDAVEHAADYAGYFGPETRIKRGWAGLYAVTPDHHPIVEETIPGFVNAIGFSGHGFQHAPAVGQIVTELVLDGDASLVDIEPLSSDRFDAGELHDEQNVA